MLYTLLSWNINGIRAIEKKGFLQWLEKESPQVLCLQETKASPDQLSTSLQNPPGYHAYWNQAEKKGYSGVAVFTKEKPLSVEYGFGIKRFDSEGRILILKFPQFTLLNIYFPNGKQGSERLEFKLNFYEAFLRYLHMLKKEAKVVVVCGDVNTAHQEIDLARPKENSTVSGFLPEERAYLDRFIHLGLVDTFRHFNKEGGNYSWWDYKTGARARNSGWRIDYFYVNKQALPNLKKAFILNDVQGSDHCPIGIQIAF